MNEPGFITTDVQVASAILNDGGVIGMPTETVYGLAARADHEDSVGRIFDIKGRPRNHPLIAHLDARVDPSSWGDLNSHASALAQAFWPGPITLLVPKTNRVGLWVTGGRSTVGLRVPSLPITQLLLAGVDEAVVAPSANRFGKVSPTTAQHVSHDLGSDVDCILDGGSCTIGLESTIVECIDNFVSILRPGAITAEQISQATGLTLSFQNTESRAPGMMVSHYAPNAKVVLVKSAVEAEFLANEQGLSRDEWGLLHNEDIELYALTMYDSLRLFDLQLKRYVYAVLPSSNGMGEAVRDRLRKASAQP
jgi:L-threonylcarbamoyladenylate synthase